VVTTQESRFLQADAEFELACVRAYNDALADWREVSDRYVPIAIIPYLSPMETIVAEVEHAVQRGHGGIVMFAEPSLAVKGLKHSNDPFWEPLWSACEDLDVPIHWHGSAGLPLYVLPHWEGFSRSELHTATTARLCATPTQAIPNLLLSGRMARHPRLKWVFAETGMGWINYVLEGCDHEWEQRHLWTEGILTRPSDAFRSQIVVDFWFETAGVELRHTIGVDNIMWESDYPHITSTYPDSWKYVERALVGVPDEDRRKMLYGTAMKLYKLG
jgi:predicted TIM-barrel fold metal-dependent hydrolase